MKILLAGLGSIGRRHLANLSTEGFDDFVLVRTGKAALKDGNPWGYPVEQNLEDALARHDPKLAIICNPTACHMDTAIPAAKAGCDLFIEKPVSHNLDLIPELESIAISESRRVDVGFHFRFHPGLKMFRDLILSGTLGVPIHACVHWGEYLPGWHPWEDYRNSYASRKDLGGGVILTLCHPFDYIRWIFGDPISVCAQTAHSGQLETDAEDVADVLLKFPSGFTAAIHLNYLETPATHTFSVLGSHALLELDFIQSRLTWRINNTQPCRLWEAPQGFERNSMFLDEIREVISPERMPEHRLASLADGVAALKIAVAAKASAECGCPQTVML